MTQDIMVEVAYATPEKQRILTCRVPLGTTVWDAAARSGITREFPGIDLENAKMGIFSHAVAEPKTHIVKDGDRIEIYRPLLIDPKEARAQRAAKAKAAKQNSSI